jgi:hypothetical protein
MTDSTSVLHSQLDQLLSAEETTFSGLCELCGIDVATMFRGRLLKDVDFDGSVLDAYNFSDTAFLRCSFVGVQKGSANFDGAKFQDCIEPPVEDVSGKVEGESRNLKKHSDEEVNQRWAELVEAVKAETPVFAYVKSIDVPGIRCSVMGFDALLPWDEKTRVFRAFAVETFSAPLTVKADFKLLTRHDLDQYSSTPEIGAKIDLVWPYQKETKPNSFRYPAWAPARDKTASNRLRAQVVAINSNWTFLKQYSGGKSGDGDIERRYQIIRQNQGLFERLLVGQVVECTQTEKRLELLGSKKIGNITVTATKTLNMWYAALRKLQVKGDLSGTRVKKLRESGILISFGGAIAYVENSKYNATLFPHLFATEVKHQTIAFKLSHTDDFRNSIFGWLPNYFADDNDVTSTDDHCDHLIELKMLDSIKVSAKMATLSEYEYLKP